MTLQLRKAERKKAKLRIGLSAPAGGGKTFSALKLAQGLTQDWKKIALIDTENGSGELYSHLGDYNIITLTAPFTPEQYIEAIKTCEAAGMETIIIDSASHEWDGKGGLLESNELLAQTKFKGNSWAAWSVTTPRHQKFIEAITTSRCHVITTARSKTDTIQTEDKKIKKVGLKDIQREGFEYELTVAFNLDRDGHYATASKDRTGIFIDKDPFVINEDTGKLLSDWANSGAADLSKELLTKEQLTNIEKLIIELAANRPEVEQWIIKTYKTSTSGLTQEQASDLITKFTAKVITKAEEKKKELENDKAVEEIAKIMDGEVVVEGINDQPQNELDKALDGPKLETAIAKQMREAIEKARKGEIIH